MITYLLPAMSLTEETEEIRKRRIQQAIESQKYLQEKILQK